MAKQMLCCLILAIADEAAPEERKASGAASVHLRKGKPVQALCFSILEILVCEAIEAVCAKLLDGTGAAERAGRSGRRAKLKGLIHLLNSWLHTASASRSVQSRRARPQCSGHAQVVDLLSV